MTTRKQRAVDAGTDRATFHTAWESAWPRLLRRCAYLFRGDMDAANDLAAEVALCLCRQHAANRLRCRDLTRLACSLAHLRSLGIWKANAKRIRRLAVLHTHIAMRNGCKVATNHEFMYDEEKNDTTEE